MSYFEDGTGWTPAKKAEYVIVTNLLSVPEICLRFCARVCGLKARLEAMYAQSEVSGPDVSKISKFTQELSNFNNATVADPCREPGENGVCTQGQVQRSF